MNRARMLNTTLGDYRVTDFVGAGGMGEVYRAAHARVGHAVALKVLTETGDQTGIHRFLEEARIQSQLHHPNIVAFHDYFEWRGCACIVMEYVDGQTLADRIRFAGPLPAAEALAIFHAVVETIAHIHRHRIIHRDIKSSNIKVARNGEVKLLDFGIARTDATPGATMREINEDRCLFRHPEDAGTRGRKGALAIVADGMGGHRAGEVASEMAVRLIEQNYYESLQLPQAALEAAFHEANRAIHQAARQQPQLSGMGTTATALVIRGGVALLAQVGDSRLYLARDGQLYLMSEDHSAVMEMVRLGKMTIEDARLHADKNLLLRALGPQPEVRVATWKTPFPVRDGDRFLLCSDGLYDLVSDDEINQAVMNEDPQAACQRLIETARERGGHDNVTVGIIRCG